MARVLRGQAKQKALAFLATPSRDTHAKPNESAAKIRHFTDTK